MSIYFSKEDQVAPTWVEISNVNISFEQDVESMHIRARNIKHNIIMVVMTRCNIHLWTQGMRQMTSKN